MVHRRLSSLNFRRSSKEHRRAVSETANIYSGNAATHSHSRAASEHLPSASTSHTASFSTSATDPATPITPASTCPVLPENILGTIPGRHRPASIAGTPKPLDHAQGLKADIVALRESLALLDHMSSRIGREKEECRLLASVSEVEHGCQEVIPAETKGQSCFTGDDQFQPAKRADKPLPFIPSPPHGTPPLTDTPSPSSNLMCNPSEHSSSSVTLPEFVTPTTPTNHVALPETLCGDSPATPFPAGTRPTVHFESPHRELPLKLPIHPLSQNSPSDALPQQDLTAQPTTHPQASWRRMLDAIPLVIFTLVCLVAFLSSLALFISLAYLLASAIALLLAAGLCHAVPPFLRVVAAGFQQVANLAPGLVQVGARMETWSVTLWTIWLNDARGPAEVAWKSGIVAALLGIALFVGMAHWR